MSDETAKCELCGEPMPPNEQMFKFHGYSGPCPKPPLPKPEAVNSDPMNLTEIRAALDAARHAIDSEMNCHTAEYRALDRLHYAVELIYQVLANARPCGE